VIYPRAVRWFAEGRLSLEKGVVRVSPDASQLVIGIDAQEAA
jgi:phosphoribosylglycinamide formyltransferase-1